MRDCEIPHCATKGKLLVYGRKILSTVIIVARVLSKFKREKDSITSYQRCPTTTSQLHDHVYCIAEA
jgi:hypothetical protein